MGQIQKEINFKGFIESIIKYSRDDVKEVILNALSDQGFTYNDQQGVIIEVAPIKRKKKPAVQQVQQQKETIVVKKEDGKIREGDWIISSTGRLCHVVEVRENGLVVDNNRWIRDASDYRKWTIKDAKSGDILATPDYILIFKEALENSGGVSYCHYSIGNNKFCYVEDRNWYFGPNAVVSPATTEQGKILFEAMKRDGYKWDSHNLELISCQRFKEGDWIVGKEYTDQIVEVDFVGNDNCRYKTEGGHWLDEEEAKSFHVWTIEDAKEGDVLVSGDNLIFVFNRVENGIALDYCGVWLKGKNGGSRPDKILAKTCLPATEDQKKYLLQRLENGGYKFDFNKLELIKIPDPKFKEGDKIWKQEDTKTINSIVKIESDHYILGDASDLPITEQDDWELVPELDETEKAVQEKLIELTKNKKLDLNNPAVIQRLSKDLLTLIEGEDDW